ncbi:lipopolysaccharide transport periplasmic protein LptA [Corticibacter populi]|uniref:Lipopolysaccharide export system protein LptA n=1 Tax=Corticibacter populi TaxID=1550736 RepID=A0A3M6QK26_9BURK|nr:lipopolysaccharide transport periplasmic protein LptA [Corticibacter populi]RMX03061.1 lipopolysaccharide transport periplasmic protein LptA [Corticibacter populi]RZS33501.1 lipopolysaccharide export system protein LptA [Corticibacter populi]
MQKSFLALLWCLSLAVLSPAAFGLASDRNQPMNIEANSLRHDDASQVTVFSGRVVLTKGSIVLRGETLTVKQAADGSQHGTIEAAAGQRAFFSQQRDTQRGAPAETVEAEAQRIEYDSQADRVRLAGNAELRRYQGGKLNDVINGAVIVYHNSTGVFTVDGAAQGGAGRGERVRAVIGSNTTGTSGAGAAGGDAAAAASAPTAPNAPAALAPSSVLGSGEEAQPQ